MNPDFSEALNSEVPEQTFLETMGFPRITGPAQQPDVIWEYRTNVSALGLTNVSDVYPTVNAVITNPNLTTNRPTYAMFEMAGGYAIGFSRPDGNLEYLRPVKLGFTAAQIQERFQLIHTLEYYHLPWLDNSWLYRKSLDQEKHDLLGNCTCGELEMRWKSLLSQIPYPLEASKPRMVDVGLRYPSALAVQPSVQMANPWYSDTSAFAHPLLIKVPLMYGDSGGDLGARNGIAAFQDQNGYMTLFACRVQENEVSVARPIAWDYQSQLLQEYTRVLNIPLGDTSVT